MFAVLAFVLALSLTNCDAVPLEDVMNEVHDTPRSIGVMMTLRRAQQVANLTWSPLASVPTNNSMYYAGAVVSGLPYSSVKELDKFVGCEVSFHTFMTAVNNPRSVLYTENVANPPYHGRNCAAYYGTVCSMAVNYALGIDMPLWTKYYHSSPLFEMAPVQDPQAVELGDILLSPGHAVLVFDIVRDVRDNSVKRVSIMESAPSGTGIQEYEITSFADRWKSIGWEIFRYVDIDKSVQYTPSPYVAVGSEVKSEVVYNSAICPQRGDQACFRKGEDVVINVLDRSFFFLDLYKDGLLFKSFEIRDPDVVLSDLDYGRYFAIASDGMGHFSEPVSFDVFDIQTDVLFLGNKIRVSYDSKYGSPEYVVTCNQYGDRFSITPIKNQSGTVDIPFTEGSGPAFCKVFFSTDYGKVSNAPIKIN